MTNEIARRSTLGFEIESCGRCGGCGRYSYNSIDGDRCYGCGGTGVRLTKRGRVAKAFFEAMRDAKAEDVKVGDLIEIRTMSKIMFRPVDEIRIGETKGRNGITGEEYESISFWCGNTGLTTWAGGTVRRGFTKAEKAEKLAQAVAFQDTLTKAGTVRKAGKA